MLTNSILSSNFVKELAQDFMKLIRFYCIFILPSGSCESEFSLLFLWKSNLYLELVVFPISFWDRLKQDKEITD
jgi:hypothetical protein